MIKSKGIFIAALILFFLVSTAYYWESMLGALNMLVLLIFAISFLILAGCLLYQIYLTVRERLNDKSRIYLVVCMVVLLGLMIIRPHGIIDFERFEAKDLLIGGREGSANCTTTLKLKEDNTFYLRTICFGGDKVGGTYRVKNDTVKFKFSSANDNFKFGILKLGKHQTDRIIGDIYLYRSKKDTVPVILNVIKNYLIKQ